MKNNNFNLNFLQLIKCGFFLIATFFLTSTTYAQTTWTVNTTDDLDDGTCDDTHCSLREAINSANNNLGANNIYFNIPGLGQHTIFLNSLLPPISNNNTIIDGTTQPGNFPMAELIIIDGSTAGTNPGFTTSGITFFINTSNCEMYGLRIQKFETYGVYSYSSNAIIGTPGKGNVIISNSGGMVIQGPNSTIQSNYIGTNLLGDQGLGNNNHGLLVAHQGHNIVIGGDRSLQEENIIVANSYSGISLVASLGTIEGNYIGVLPNNNEDFGNPYGIIIANQNNLNSGDTDIIYNTISNCTTNGIFNTGVPEIRISRNSLYCNNVGINVYDNQYTVLIPKILSADLTLITGKSLPFNTIEVFLSDDTGCPGAACQGKTFIGTATSNIDGYWQLPVNLTNGDVVTATATDQNNNTSQFAVCKEINSCLGTTLPGDWQNIDIGQPLTPGWANYYACEEEFEVGSSGYDGALTSDAMHFVYKEMCCNSTIIAKVDNISTATGIPGYAGIMIREKLVNNARTITLKTKLSNFLYRGYRAAPGGILWNKITFAPQHTWLKLVRNGDYFTGYSRYNENSPWVFRFQAKVLMEDCVWVGLFSESYNQSIESVATFSGVSAFCNEQEFFVPELDDEITSIVNKQDISVFPNPSFGNVTIDIENSIGKTIEINVVNNLGETIHSISIRKTEHPSHMLDLSTYKNGVYMINVLVDRLPVVSKKIVLIK